MKGLGRHHSTAEKKQVTGQSVHGFACLAGSALPRTASDVSHQDCCEKEGVPFKRKVDLAYDGIEEFIPVPGEHVHVLVDAWYTCQRLWKAAHARGFDFSGGLNCNRKLRRTTPDEKRDWQHLSGYAAELSSAQFQAVVWPARDGGRTVWVHCVHTIVHRFGACQVVIVREKLDAAPEQPRYLATSLLAADAQTIVSVLAVR
jgi:hypothetical protein